MLNYAEKQAALYKLERLTIGISGHRIPVFEALSNELGYTTKDNKIFISYTHPLISSLSNPDILMFTRGVFTHEMLHVLITDFGQYFKAIETFSKNSQETNLFSVILNICEDAAIEYFAHNFFDDIFLRAIEFKRAVLYKKLPPLEEYNDSVEQITQAMIFYKIGGFPKGDFTFPEAKETFAKILPLLINVTHEPIQAKRIEYCKEIYDIIYPLAKDTLDERSIGFDAVFNPENNGTGAGKDDCEQGDDNSGIEKRRQFIVQKFAAGNPQEDDGDKSEDKSNNESEDKNNDQGEDKNAEKTEAVLFSELYQEGVISNDEKNELDNELKAATQELAQKAAKEQEQNEKDFKFPISKGYKNVCSKVTVKHDVPHLPATIDMRLVYQDIVNPLQPQINLLVNQLQRILKNKRSEKLYSQSGRVSIKRLNSSRRTARVFTSTKGVNEADYAVAIAVDCSGSMRGTNIEQAKQIAIIMAEAFAKLDIPIYIYGFTTEYDYYEAKIVHYVNWGNSQQDRYSLLNLEASQDNFDGHAIRWGSELLKRQKAENKLLIVVSDGLPFCSVYTDAVRKETPSASLWDVCAFGVKDTQLAISEASKTAKVVGIMLGDELPERHRMMYGYNFIHCININDLFAVFAKTLKSYLKEN